MGTRGRAVAVALVAATAGTAMPGWASPTAPEPTTSVATYVQGVRLPTNIATAAWSKVKPGCAGVMTVSGPSLSGTTTVARGAITSRWFRPRRGLLMSVFGSQAGDTIWQPLAEGFDMKFRVREKSHRWTPWFGMSLKTEPSSPPLPLLFEFSIGGGFAVGEMSRDSRPLPVQQVQARIVDTATSTGTLSDSFSVKMGC